MILPDTRPVDAVLSGMPANAQSTRAAGVPISACIEEWDVGGMGGHRTEPDGVKRNSMALSTASGGLGRAAQTLAETGEAGRFPLYFLQHLSSLFALSSKTGICVAGCCRFPLPPRFYRLTVSRLLSPAGKGEHQVTGTGDAWFSGVNDILWGSFKEGGQIIDGNIHQACARLLSRPGDVWRDEAVWRRKQRIIGRRRLG